MAGDPEDGFAAGVRVPAAVAAERRSEGKEKGPTGGKQSLASQC